MRVVSAVFAAAVALCVGSGALAQQFAASGSWVSVNKDLAGSWSTSFAADSTLLDGTMQVVGLTGVTGGHIAGSLDGSTISFGVIYNDQEVATFEGKLNQAQLSGTFTTSSGPGGTWSGNLEGIPAQGSSVDNRTPVRPPTSIGGDAQ